MLNELFELLLPYVSTLDYFTTKVKEFRDDGTFKYNIKLFSKNEKDTIALQKSLERFEDEDNISIQINDYPLKKKPEILDQNTISVTISQRYLSDETIYLFFEKDFLSVEEQFLERCRFQDLSNQNTKIVIRFSRKELKISSPIFSISEADQITLPQVLVNEKNFQSVSLFAVPNLVNSSNIRHYSSNAIDSILELLTDKKISDDEFIINFNRNSILNKNKIEIVESTFENLYAILNFIFSEPNKYYDRLVIFKELFSQLVNEKDELFNKDFDILLTKLQSNYNLFITDKMKSYIDDKNKLIEEYAKIHNETIAGIRTVINDLTQQITVLSGTMLAFLLFDGVENLTKILISSVVAMLYLGFITFVNCQKGWNFESEAISKNQKRVKSMYQLLNSVDSEFIQLRDDEFKKDLKKLEKIEKVNKFICISLLLISFLIVLWA